ncbi:16S rRNA (guanine(527)-N(7))-methyltransferase RsmG [Pasteurellaceae bacterium HPA106]|uniref:16S rRNA (guanine(527)-N(7))-methyltransferase RsmG n=1 Tax=Spirabiliibacterium pneumoniae TaxID=221400 RepID=UPI001AAD1153|nr:16S rRNA (guanine(527)-N(7))-methyltransferase RsmG [Spirabiliibacterium pneumoniae]MBE2896823.1 16S rRNA (guanine(527)-N(7))-methyltransferase RsmG [Spirabiliibacterium pneumoniae]
MRKHLDNLLNQTALSVLDSQRDQLVAYVELLHKWNKAYNLTSVRDPQEMLVKHIMDSLVVSEHLQGKTFIDVGTGPGLPGIPLAIIQPDCQFTLLDSLGKRVRFLQQAITQLGLTHVEAVQSRVEDYDKVRFDGVLSRAFASLSDMINWCAHLPNEQGHFYALKGHVNAVELNTLPHFIKVDKKISLNVPELIGERNLIVLSKVA